MILTIAACVAATNFGPVTGAAAVQRRNMANAEAVRVTVIDGSLNARIVQLVQLEAAVPQQGGRASTGQVITIDERGTRSTLPLGGGSGILAIAPSWWVLDETTSLTADSAVAARRATTPGAADPASSARVQLTDGQRLIGHLGAPELDADRDDQSIRWIHPQLGGLTLPLDRLRRVELLIGAPGPGGTLAAAGATSELDVVSLMNGDRVEGYVESITGGDDGAVAVSRGTPTPKGAAPAAPTTMAIAQVASINLGNPTERPRGLMLWLGDASVIAAQRIDIDAANARVTLNAQLPAAPGSDAAPQSGPTSLDLADLRAVAFDAGRITPLSQLPLTAFAAQGGRRIAEPPRIRPVAGDGWPSPLGADDIELPGPMLAEWELPPGAVRLAGWVSLDPAAQIWGDCEVSLSVIGGDSAAPRDLARQRISAAQPLMPVNVVLPGLPSGARLRVTVEPGERGPIQDRVNLRRMLVLTTAGATTELK